MPVESFKKITRLLPEPALLVTGEGQILAVNPSFSQTLKLSGSELNGRTLFEIAATPEPKLRTYLNICSRNGQLLIGALELFGHGDQAISFRCEGAVLEPATETSEAIIFLRLKAKESASSTFRVLTEKIAELNREIAERKRAEEESERLYREAQEANRLKDEFLATVSHELRTPLNSILGWARMLKNGKFDEQMLEKALETIERNARSQTQLIEDLLDVSRIISGKLRLDIRPLDPAQIVSIAIESLRPAADNKQVRLEIAVDPRLELIAGDANRLQQALWNLLANAIKFTPPCGCVEVRLVQRGSHIEINVSDTGEGISPEFLPFVFDRFRQFDCGKTRQHGGLGLGLAIVRHLIELHGGTVQASSEGVGRGATFIIRLPVRVVSEQPPSSAESFTRQHPTAEDSATLLELSRNLKDLHVLVTDDETDTRELLKVILEESKAKVTLAASAAEAFELVRKINPDVLISDIEMPNEDGYTLIRRVRQLPDEKLKKIPAVALTAHARAEDRMQSLSAGFDSHLAKPFEPAQLIVVVEELARRVKNFAE